MLETITVVSTPPLRARYNRLLTTNWKKETLPKILDLLWDEINSSKHPLTTTLREVLDPRRRKPVEPEVRERILEEIKHFRHYFQESIIPEIPPPVHDHRRSRIDLQAE